MRKAILILALLFSSLASAQSYNFNIGGLRFYSGSSVPGSCSPDGTWFFKNTATTGWYQCQGGTFVQVPLSAGASSGSTVGIGGFWGVLGKSVIAGGAGSGSTDAFINETGNFTTDNLVRVLMFCLESQQIVGHGTLQVTTAVAGTTIDVGIYSIAGNRLLALGGVSAASTGNVSASFTQVTLNPGYYYFAYAGHSSGSIAALGTFCVSFGAQVIGQTTSLININGVRQGTAANSAVGGVLPATLGALTATQQNVSDPPVVWFEP